MDHACNRGLAGARFSTNKDRRIERSDLLDFTHQATVNVTVGFHFPDGNVLAVRLFQVAVFVGDSVGLDCFFDVDKKLLRIEGLGHKLKRAGTHGFNGVADIVRTGQYDDLYRWVMLFQILQDLKAAQVGQFQINNRDCR